MNIKHIPPLFRIPLKYGFFGGLMAIVLQLLLYYFQRFPAMPFERILLYGVFIFFGIKEYRDYKNEGYLFFWQGMIAGIVCYMAMSLVVAVFIEVWGLFSTAYVDGYVAYMQHQLELNSTELLERVGQETYSAQVKKLPLTTMADLALDYVLKSMVIGIFLTIIISVILRRQPKT